MPPSKTFRGITHDLAHHSQSGLSWLHPHLANVCRAAGVLEASVDLLAPDPYPAGLSRLEPLRLALEGLRDWFVHLLTRLGYDKAGLGAASLSFRFREGDDYNSAVQATIATVDGREYIGHVDFI